MCTTNQPDQNWVILGDVSADINGAARYHRLTLAKGVPVDSFRYFLLAMHIPNLVMHVVYGPFFLILGSYYSRAQYLFKNFVVISRFGICIGRRKYLKEYTLFTSVSLCNMDWHIRTRSIPHIELS